ncbi:PAS domain-containing protein [Campylobacter sp. MG1]|uniref:PAS domain-containing protein n=1 Tax=Campylobacter sp. MG1 TaxID=2976332 RepID=UPI00226CC9E1|nr:PAS domain-containing protein [Campylobacter sp. MG1]
MEKELDNDTFIITKTDLKGYITYANKAFLDIVNAKENDLLNKAHNIIRHPDMPKAIFRYLWNELKDNKEVFAFVKNKTFDGGYYWVFANISTSYNLEKEPIGYYSVRRAINKNAKDNIINLYANMLKIEKLQGIQASWNYLRDILNGLSYDEFVLNLQGK